MSERNKIPFSKDGTNIIPESNSLMMYNSIVRIEYKHNKGEEVGTGFFMKIPYENENENEYFNFLVTNCHVIPESFVEEKKEIDIFFGNSKKERNRKIDLDRNKRYIKCNKDCDYTVIQILNRDNISNGKYLYPEPNYKKGCEFYFKPTKPYEWIITGFQYCICNLYFICIFQSYTHNCRNPGGGNSCSCYNTYSNSDSDAYIDSYTESDAYTKSYIDTDSDARTV